MLSTLDQELNPTKEDLQLFDDVDEIIGKSVTAGDPMLAIGYGRNLVTGSIVRGGPALAKLLYHLKANWHLFQSSGFDDMYEDFIHVHMGLEQSTVIKYVRMWESIFENPSISEPLKKKLIGKGVRQLLLLTATAREGADEPTLKWIAEATDESTLRERIREHRGARTSSKTALTLFMYMRTRGGHPAGTIFVSKDGKRREICSVPLDSDDPLVKQGIEALINGRKIREVS